MDLLLSKSWPSRASPQVRAVDENSGSPEFYHFLLIVCLAAWLPWIINFCIKKLELRFNLRAIKEDAKENTGTSYQETQFSFLSDTLIIISSLDIVWASPLNLICSPGAAGMQFFLAALELRNCIIQLNLFEVLNTNKLFLWPGWCGSWRMCSPQLWNEVWSIMNCSQYKCELIWERKTKTTPRSGSLYVVRLIQVSCYVFHVFTSTLFTQSQIYRSSLSFFSIFSVLSTTLPGGLNDKWGISGVSSHLKRKLLSSPFVKISSFLLPNYFFNIRRMKETEPVQGDKDKICHLEMN